MKFTIPGSVETTDATPTLSPELSQLVNESVARFEKRLGIFKQTAWVEDYRRELEAVAAAAFASGERVRDEKSGVGGPE